MNKRHTTGVKHPSNQLLARNITLLDPQTLALSTCQVKHTAILKHNHDKIQPSTSVTSNYEHDKTSPVSSQQQHEHVFLKHGKTDLK